ncbi:MAG TPA: ATP-binding protein, partial [Mucilaginibacter sp.]
YTPSGKVEVSAVVIPQTDEYRLLVMIEDTGKGISQEQQANLFSKFYQTNSAKGQTGSGLGLYICKQLVELQKGQISVKSNVGSGTTFTFFIPYQKHISTKKSDNANNIKHEDTV